jgi:hypothetical protein
MSVTEIKSLLDKAKKQYDAGANPSDVVRDVALVAISTLAKNSNRRSTGTIDGKDYSVFEANKRLSRPYLPQLYISDINHFSTLWRDFASSINGNSHYSNLAANDINRLLYSSVTSFSVCYDLWNPGARKTPGTFFEVLVGTVFGLLLPNLSRTKFISIPNENESVSTDIVFTKTSHSGGLVIPTKITTRDRVVQPFAHQRILDSVFGAGHYRSILLCVSELQRAGEDDCNEICVPGTIRLFQKHLSKLSGIFYLDPPSRYLKNDVTSVIAVETIGDLLQAGNISRLLSQNNIH